jgi:hypothetical protein
LWGGYGNIIVPTDGNSIEPIFWDLLEKFDPDHLILYQRSAKDLRIDQPEIFDGLLQRHIAAWEKQINEKASDIAVEQIKEQLERCYLSNFSISDNLQTQLKDRLSPFFFRNWIVETTHSADEDPAYPHTQLVDVLPALRMPLSAVQRSPLGSTTEETLWAGSQCGYCLPSTLERLESAGLALVTAVGADQTLDCFFGQLLSNAFPDARGRHTHSIADASICGLGWYRHKSFHYWEEPTIVVVGDTLRDFCIYQCMSRLRERVVWLLPSIGRDALNQTKIEAEKRYLRDGFKFLAALHSLTSHSATHTDSVVLVSASLGGDGLSGVRDYASQFSLFGAETWRVGLLQQTLGFHPLRLYEANNARMPALVSVSDDRVVELLEPRRPKFLGDFSPSKIRWVSEISFAESELPRHFALAEWMMGNSANTTKEIRISSEGLAFLTISSILFGGHDAETASVRPNIRIPTARQIFELASRCGDLACAVSDKGVYTSTAIQKFGGLEKLAAFFRSDVGRAFLAAYRQQKGTAAPGIYLNDDRRRYLDFTALQEIAGNRDTAAQLQDDFAEKRIFYRGFIFRCRFCSRCAWFAVGEVSDSFVCKRCHREQIYTKTNWKMPDQPNWYHQLDEVIYQGVINDMHVPVLALDSLRRRGVSGLTFSEELAYTEISSDKPFIESDLNCVVDGQLTIGEAKTGDSLGGSSRQEAKTLASFRKLVMALRARRVVFATQEKGWRKATEDKIRAAFADLPVRLQLLHHKDLYEVP